MKLTKEQQEKLDEVKMFTVAGLSLKRPISVNDIRYAVEKGFNEGLRFSLSTSQGEGTELSFKVPSANATDKPCPECNSKGKIECDVNKSYTCPECCGTGKARL